MSNTMIRAFVPDSLTVNADGRTIVGLAVPFNVPTEIHDINGSYREQFAPGAFTRTIAERGPSKVKLLLQHNSQKLPIGRAVSLTETPEGLVCELRVSNTPDGDLALELVKDGALDGLSIGFQPINQATERDGLVTRTEVKLLEISLTGFPAYDNARVAAVRSNEPNTDVLRARATVALHKNRTQEMTDDSLARQGDILAGQIEASIESGNISTLEARTAELEKINDQLAIAKRDRDIEAAKAAHPEVRTLARTSEPETWLPSLHEYRQMQNEQRAVGTSGAFVPVSYGQQFFEHLRRKTSVLAAGPVIIPIEHAGSLKIPTTTSGVTVIGTVEGGTITDSDPTLVNVTLDPKKYSALTKVNSETVDDSNPQVRDLVANILISDIAVELDRQLITGSGTGNDLTGLRNISSPTDGPSTGAAGTALTFDILADTVAAAETANLDPDNLAWFMHSRTWGSVRKLKDTATRPIVAADPTVGVPKALFGRPVFTSNNLSITETVGGNSDCSTILLVDMSRIVVGVSRQIEVQMSTDYAFATDQVAVRATCRYDIAATHSAAIVRTVGVRA